VQGALLEDERELRADRRLPGAALAAGLRTARAGFALYEGPVRAEQANQLALLDHEVDTPQRLNPPVALPQSPDGKGRHAASVRGSKPPPTKQYRGPDAKFFSSACAPWAPQQPCAQDDLVAAHGTARAGSKLEDASALDPRLPTCTKHRTMGGTESTVKQRMAEVGLGSRSPSGAGFRLDDDRKHFG
jgi:hypothetical protein